MERCQWQGMLGQKWGARISRALHPSVLVQRKLLPLETPPPLCCSQLYVFSFKHLTKHLVSSMWKLKCFHRRAIENHRHRFLRNTRHAVVQQWPAKLKAAWPCISSDPLYPFGNQQKGSFNSHINRDFAVGALAPLGVSLSGSDEG